MQSTEQMEANRSLPTLSLNSQGEAVKYLQTILNYYGYSLTIDGIFGAKTEAAVKQFQKSRSLKVDGIVGPKTWNALLADYMPSRPILRLNSKGDRVKYLQELLNCYGYSLKVDGIFGAKTEAAVKQFQKSHSLKVDGIVGPKTWSELIYNCGQTEFNGTLRIGQQYSYVFYFGEQSGDSVVYFFENNSVVSKKITSVCKNNSPCFGLAILEQVQDNQIPQEIPESTSGTYRIISVLTTYPSSIL